MVPHMTPPPISPDETIDREQLLAALEVTGVSQSALARRIGMTGVAVNRWCRGKAPLSRSRWIAVLSALALSPSWSAPADVLERVRAKIGASDL